MDKKNVKIFTYPSFINEAFHGLTKTSAETPGVTVIGVGLWIRFQPTKYPTMKRRDNSGQPSESMPILICLENSKQDSGTKTNQDSRCA